MQRKVHTLTISHYAQHVGNANGLLETDVGVVAANQLYKIGLVITPTFLLVGTARFELATPCPPGMYATRLRYAPNLTTIT